jgi:hypothetical protein
MARVTPSMSALTKFSVTGSLRFAGCWATSGAGAARQTASSAVRARVQSVVARRGDWRELVRMVIRSK